MMAKMTMVRNAMVAAAAGEGFLSFIVGTILSGF